MTVIMSVRIPGIAIRLNVLTIKPTILVSATLWFIGWFDRSISTITQTHRKALLFHMITQHCFAGGRDLPFKVQWIENVPEVHHLENDLIHLVNQYNARNHLWLIHKINFNRQMLHPGESEGMFGSQYTTSCWRMITISLIKKQWMSPSIFSGNKRDSWYTQ